VGYQTLGKDVAVMGLDIRAYSKVRFVRPGEMTDEEYDDWENEETSLRTVFAYRGFEASTLGLMNHDVVSEIGSTKAIAVGVYDVHGCESYSFQAGSYGSYNLFRRSLANYSGVEPENVWGNPDKYNYIPFFELIHFADNEGCIGPESAQILLNDFLLHMQPYYDSLDKADVWEVEHYREKYESWIDALTLAADDGLVVFC
jgi:hypothetical protein